MLKFSLHRNRPDQPAQPISMGLSRLIPIGIGAKTVSDARFGDDIAQNSWDRTAVFCADYSL